MLVKYFQSRYHLQMTSKYVILTLVFSVYGSPTVNFTAVPKLYADEECRMESPKFVDRLNNPRVGDKTTSNARAACVPLSDDEVEQLVKGLEQDRRNSNYLYANHYMTLAVRVEGETDFSILPHLDLFSREACSENGEFLVRRMTGAKSKSGTVAEVLFNCVPMSVSEASAIITRFRGSERSSAQRPETKSSNTKKPMSKPDARR